GFAETDDACDVFGSGAEAALMMPAVEKLLNTRAAADVESANAFGAVDFVRRERKEVDAKGLNIDRNFAGGLHGIAVKPDFGLASHAANFLERLHRAELVVGVHDGN